MTIWAWRDRSLLSRKLAPHARSSAQQKVLKCLGACVLALALVLSDHLSAASEPNWEVGSLHAARFGATYRGGLVTPPLSKPRFTLTDTAGAPFEFWKRTLEHVTLLFFGYTRCPGECPLHMANIAAGLRNMPAGLAGQVQVVFVTTDPARDSPQVLRAWLDHFDTRFIGLTGSEAAIELAQTATGVFLARKAALAAGNNAAGHASFVLAYTKDNLAHLIYPGGVTQKDWAHDLPHLVNEAWSSR
ncbi:MAG TPA: SCO family protein [Candidatus Methylomirabilis sp.]|nr:SCO family protein [Candidatus Methylomirabilis sp.]